MDIAIERPTNFDVDSAQALEIIEAYAGPLLIDFDETLYLRNSTEDFIATAHPATLAVLALRLLDKIRPWRMTGGPASRDNWRVLLILILFPWTLLLWQFRARKFAGDGFNEPLLASLQKADERPVVVTFGFRPIVGPLLRAAGLDHWRLVYPRVLGFKNRCNGKLMLAVDEIGAEQVSRALVLTDSYHDKDILDACAKPLRVVWAQAHFMEAFQHLYLPGQYLSRVKRPGTQYIYRGIVLEDFAFWVLSSVFLASIPLMHLAGLAMVAVSFWAIYECGYVDNDQMGARFEKDPKLSAEFGRQSVNTSSTSAWLWALTCGLLGIALLRYPAMPDVTDLLAWTGILLVTFFGFRLYNRFDKHSRIWMFAGLQCLRTFAFIVLVPVTAIGMAALCAHALARWVPYIAYRQSGGKWSDGNQLTVRLVFFAMLTMMVGYLMGWALLLTPSAGLIVLWMGYQARHELRDIFGSAHRIDTGEARTAGN